MQSGFNFIQTVYSPIRNVPCNKRSGSQYFGIRYWNFRSRCITIRSFRVIYSWKSHKIILTISFWYRKKHLHVLCLINRHLTGNSVNRKSIKLIKDCIILLSPF